MKKHDLKKLALMGVAGGLLIANQSELQAQEAQGGASEGQLLGQLSQDGRALYQSLDAEGQTLARLVAKRCGCGGNQQNINYGGCGAHCGSASSSSHGANHSSCGSAGSCAHGNGNGYQGYQGGSSCGTYQGGNYQGQQAHCASGNGPQAHCGGQNRNYQGQGQQAHCASANGPQSHCGGQNRVNQPSQNSQNPSAFNQRNQASKYQANAQMTEQELLSKLSADGKREYNSLTPEGKRLAQQLASQDCKNKNSCAGLNSCSSPENSCKGKGSCAGKSPGPFTDKNDAVKVAAMKDKRVTSLRTNY